MGTAGFFQGGQIKESEGQKSPAGPRGRVPVGDNLFFQGGQIKESEGQKSPAGPRGRVPVGDNLFLE